MTPRKLDQLTCSAASFVSFRHVCTLWLGPGLLKVLHPCQHATNGGTFPAVARLALRTELAVAGVLPTYAVSVDFKKMFNMLSLEVATHCARRMGLSEPLITSLESPLRLASFAWRLPMNAKCELHTLGRGLPQGMAGSVLLAECQISPLLWRIHWATLNDPESLMVAYVDDLNFCCSTPRHLVRILELLFEFETDFQLSLSSSKTMLWSTDPAECAKVSQWSGFQATSTLSALGADWATTKDAAPPYEKETHRIEELERRLSRLQHLPCALNMKLELVSVACPISA